jgi:hypothetical protein
MTWKGWMHFALVAALGWVALKLGRFGRPVTWLAGLAWNGRARGKKKT